ncbi:hypothetical protein [Paenibacillus melissococcoides]|uniref:hypothetical protein n=1 Tax=Paenibacillus melissococcoides TaxID=2912268 RepID=UPI0021C4398D|nr:hypothetical protein [Paenibacillus melissococcoides]CAH8719710.1 hypothetical protein HTL2_005696 [Paenibacillus melissococcoides]
MKHVEQQVIEQLTGYRDIVGRLRVLETYSVGTGSPCPGSTKMTTCRSCTAS